MTNDTPKKLTSDVLLQAKIFRITKSRYRFPDGHESDWFTVDHPGAVSVIPVHPDGEVTLIRQYRPAVESWLWEVPAGSREPDEPPEECARRELIEEVGLKAEKIELLLNFHSAPGFCSERFSAYIGTGLTETASCPEPGELIEVHRFPLEKALGMVRSGEITDAKTILSLWALRENK